MVGSVKDVLGYEKRPILMVGSAKELPDEPVVVARVYGNAGRKWWNLGKDCIMAEFDDFAT